MAFPKHGEGPWGGRVLRDIVARAASGWPAGLTVFTGDDLYHLDRAFASVFERLVPDRGNAFGWSVFGDAPVSPGGIVGAARASGMFSSRRVVVLRDISVLEGDPEPLEAFAKAPPRDAYLLVRAPKLDRKRKLHKALAESGTCLTFRLPAGEQESGELAREVAAYAAERKIVLAPKAAELLVAVCGFDLLRILTELDKLADWRGPGAEPTPVDARTLRDLVAGAALLTGWELADAVLERDRAGALAAARRLLDAGDEPIRIVGGLAYRARALLQAKGLALGGASREEILRSVKGAWFFKEALARGQARYTLSEALAMPGSLLAADRTFKSRSIDKGAVLEALVSGWTRPATPEGR